jgi:hypothetical protein
MNNAVCWFSRARVMVACAGWGSYMHKSARHGPRAYRCDIWNLTARTKNCDTGGGTHHATAHQQQSSDRCTPAVHTVRGGGVYPPVRLQCTTAPTAPLHRRTRPPSNIPSRWMGHHDQQDERCKRSTYHVQQHHPDQAHACRWPQPWAAAAPLRHSSAMAPATTRRSTAH